MPVVKLTDAQIRNLWEDPSFDQSFRGLSIFRDALLTKKGVKISMAKLKDIMASSTAYLDNLRRPQRFQKRRSEVDGFGQLVQIDLGFLAKSFNYNG